MTKQTDLSPSGGDSNTLPRRRQWSAKRLLQALSLGLLASGSVQAATNVIDFSTDPTGSGLYSWFGNVNEVNGNPAPWRPSGGASGAANDGYLAITDAAGSLHSALVFKDLENGLIIKSFTFDCDLRIGGGTDPAADGFSVSVVSATDPVVVAADAGNDPTGSFAGIGTETGLPEEGTTTGLSVGFDQWQSGTEDPQDVVGLSVRVEGQLIAQFPIPLGAGGTNIYLPTMPVPGQQGNLYVYDNSGTYANQATNSANYPYALQTGARNTTDDLNGDGVVDSNDPGTAQPAYGSPNFDLWLKNLKWEHFHMEVSDSGDVKISWKGRELTPPGGFHTTFAPRVARIVFAGRTGGSWSAMHVDNIKLVTQPFTSAAVSGFAGNGGGFTVQVEDQGTTTLDPSSLSLKLNGNAVTGQVSKVGLVSYIHYTAPQALTIGTTNVVDIAYKDNHGIASTAQRTFIVGNYATVPAADAMAAGSVDTSGSGFNARMSQIPITRAPGDANSIANAERQFANGFIDPATSQPYANMVAKGPNADGSYPVTSTINFNAFPDSAGGADIGDFRATNEPPYNIPDQAFPGIPGEAVEGTDPVAAGFSDNIVAELTGYLDLAAGFYTFGVNSDDGFLFSTAPGVGDVLGTPLGSFNGGKGSSDVNFDVYVPTAGIYPVRLLWWQGGGGANLEFYYIDQTTGVKTLVNDRTAGFQVKAYPKATSTKPYVSSVSPSSGYGFTFADADVSASITDGTDTVNAGSVSLTLNGKAVSATPTKSGSVTTIKAAGSLSNLLPPGQNTATLVYSYTDAGKTVTVTNDWSFTVVPYQVIPVANKVASASGAGFKVRVNQIDRSLDANQGNGGRLPNGDQNRMPRPEIQLAGGNINPTNGLAYPNLATPGPNADGSYDVPDVINFNSPNGNSGIFGNDNALPGLPGQGTSNSGNDNYVAEFTTYLDLKAGAYIFAVNSDDGFIVSSSPDPHDTLGTLLGYANVGRGNASPLPVPGGPESFVPTPGTSQNNFAFGVVVPQDGTYPFRILYWQGGGGVNVEFLTVDKANGQQFLVGDTANNPRAVAAHNTYTGPARPWVKFSVSPTPWDNRIQQAGPGPIKAVGRTASSTTSGDIENDSDSRRPWADVAIGGVLANLGSGSASLLLNGAQVPATLTPSGSDTVVSYRPNPPLPSGSTNTASLVYAGTTNSWTFIVQTYTNLNASDALPATAADTTAPGFKVKVVQATTSQPNTVARAESQLAGAVPNVALPGPNADGSYTIPGIINWNNNLNPTTSGGAPNANGTPIGNFEHNTYGSGWPFGDHPDDPIPGLPGTGLANCDNSAAEVFAYLKFDKAGYYRFGVNSDDGFAVKVGTPGQTNGTVIFSLDAGKGASDVPFSFVVPQAGLYPIRLVWYNGGGGANLEFFSYDDNGNKVPINDVSNPASIKAYYRATSSTPASNLAIARQGNNVVISWKQGALQSASTILGPWTAVPGATSPTTVPIGPGAAFYRVQ